MKRQIVVFVTAIMATLIASASSAVTHAVDKPNVLLICCDDLNQSLGCYGNKQVQAARKLKSNESRGHCSKTGPRIRSGTWHFPGQTHPLAGKS